MSIRRASIVVVMVGTALVGITSSVSADTSARTLTAEQASAKAAFTEQIKPALKELKETCGVDLSVATDFENYDEAAWFKAERIFSRSSDDAKREEVAQACNAVIVTIASYCKPPEPEGKPQRPSGPRPAPTPAWKGPPVSALSCLFAGAKPKQADDQADDYTQRNMSFANGTFTMHLRPQLPNQQENAFAILKGHPISETEPQKNGGKCTGNNDCRSRLCSPRGMCMACTSDAACGGSRVCQREACFVPNAPSADSGSTDPKTPKGKAAKKPLGGKCKSNDDCESKICGTISSGQLHKCVSKR